MSDEILDKLKNIQEQIKKTDKKIEEIFEMQRVADKQLSHHDHLFNDVYKTFQQVEEQANKVFRQINRKIDENI